MTDTNDLPPLPDGWRWVMNAMTGNWMASLDAMNTVEVEATRHGIEIGHKECYTPRPVPYSVLSAVLRANGYSFTS